MPYLTFFSQGTSASGKTKIWSVMNQSGGNLGGISWFSHWRRYVYQPITSVILDAQCLSEIAAFCEKETREKK